MKGRDRPNPVAARVAIEVNGEAWTQVPDLGRSGPDDPHYAVHHDSRGSSSVEFGDGRHGRRIPPGATVKATYSRGSGRGRDSVAVTLHRTDTPSTPDQPLWTAVRDRNDGVAVTLHRTDTPPSPDQPLWGVVRTADDEVGVTLHSTDTPPTPDQPLWVVVRDRGDAISFDHYAQDPDVARPPGAGLRRGVWCVVLGALLLGLLLFCLLGTLHWPR